QRPGHGRDPSRGRGVRVGRVGRRRQGRAYPDAGRNVTSPDRFAALWRSLAPIGRTPNGYHRLSWTDADLACREWFLDEAADRGLQVQTDGNGNLWGWLGARLLTGALDPQRAAGLRDRDGVRLAEAMKSAGVDTSGLGPDPDRLARIGMFIELHIEQGRALAVPVGVASAIWPHGRWRME